MKAGAQQTSERESFGVSFRFFAFGGALRTLGAFFAFFLGFLVFWHDFHSKKERIP